MTDLRAELAALVEPLMREHVVPGVAVALVAPDQDATAAFGITNAEHPLPVDGDTLFQSGSLTKTFTATALLVLAEAGRLDLDAPLRRYMPEFRVMDADVSARVTTRHLLTHSAGWFGDHYIHTGSGDDALARYVATFDQLAQITPLGSMWNYCNSAFGAAGRLIEVLTGMTYEAAVARLVLEPLGMRRAFFFMDEAVSHRFANGHFLVDGKAVPVRPWPISRCHYSSGGLVTTANDMLLYMRSHLGSGTPLLSPAMLRETQRSQVPGAVGLTRAMPWIHRVVGGQPILLHGGGGPRSGQKAQLAIAPEKRTAVVTFTNAPAGQHVFEAVTRWWLRRFVGVEAERPVPRARPPAELAAYAGMYKSRDEDLELRLADGGLVLHTFSRKKLAARYDVAPPIAPPVPIAFTGTDRFIVTDGPTKDVEGELLRDDAGAPTWLWFDGRIYQPRA